MNTSDRLSNSDIEGENATGGTVLERVLVLERLLETNDIAGGNPVAHENPVQGEAMSVESRAFDQLSAALRERDRRIEDLQRENAILSQRIAGLERSLQTEPASDSNAQSNPVLKTVNWRSGDDLALARQRIMLPTPSGATERFVQIGSVAGFYSDGWAEQQVATVFLIKRPVKEISVYVWIPADSIPNGIHIQVVCNGLTLVTECIAGDKPWRIPATLDAAEGDLVSLQLGADQSFRRPPPDERQLSFVLKGIDFK